MGDVFQNAVSEERAKEILEQRTALDEAKNFAENDVEPDALKTERPMAMPTVGYKVFPVETLPSKGKMYPVGFEFSIKPATAKEVRHFSSVDNNDPIGITEKMNFILKNNCKFKNPAHNYKDLLDIDRFAIVYAIRQLTFKDSPNLTSRLECPNCGTENDIVLHGQNFMNFRLDDRLEKFFDVNEKCYIFKTNDFDFKIYIPSIGTAEFITKLAEDAARSSKFFDEDFVNIAPFLFKSYKAINEKTFKEVGRKTLEWSPEKMSAVIQVIELIRESIDPNVKYTCKECGSENDQLLTFRNGFKELFTIQSDDIFDKFI